MSIQIWALVFSGLIFARGAHGIQDYMEPGDSNLSCFRTGTQAGYAFAPKCEETVSRRGQTTLMRYNSMGLRDKEFSAMPLANWERIFFAGPSLLAGPGLPEKFLPTRFMEKFLRANLPRVEVINGGVEGYTSIHSATMMPAWQQAYNPTTTLQLVPAAIYERDILYWPFLEKISDDRWQIQFENLPRQLKWLAHAGISENQVSKKVRTWIAYGHRAARTIQCKAGEYIGIDSTICIFGPTLQGALRIKERAEKSGAKYIFVYSYSPQHSIHRMPFVGPFFDLGVAEIFDRLTPTIEIKRGSLEAWLVKNKVPYILVPFPFSDQYTLPRDYHFNKKGSELFAREVAQALLPLLGQSPIK